MNDDDYNFAEERIRLEREALAVERERLAAACAHAEAEASLLLRRRRPVLAFFGILLLVLIAATCGFLGGMAVMESRQNREREVRRAEARSQIDPNVPTNGPSEFSGADRSGPEAPRRPDVFKIR